MSRKVPNKIGNLLILILILLLLSLLLLLLLMLFVLLKNCAHSFCISNQYLSMMDFLRFPLSPSKFGLNWSCGSNKMSCLNCGFLRISCKSISLRLCKLIGGKGGMEDDRDDDDELFFLSSDEL